MLKTTEFQYSRCDIFKEYILAQCTSPLCTLYISSARTWTVYGINTRITCIFAWKPNFLTVYSAYTVHKTVCATKPEAYRLICSRRHRLGFYAEIQNIFGTVSRHAVCCQRYSVTRWRELTFFHIFSNWIISEQPLRSKIIKIILW